jgi:hypothetical protein
MGGISQLLNVPPAEVLVGLTPLTRTAFTVFKADLGIS